MRWMNGATEFVEQSCSRWISPWLPLELHLDLTFWASGFVLLLGAYFLIYLLHRCCIRRPTNAQATKVVSDSSSYTAEINVSKGRLSAECIASVREYVAMKMAQNDASHDILHVDRVYRYACALAVSEIRRGNPINWMIVELGTYLHDLLDWKYVPSVPLLKSVSKAGTPAVIAAHFAALPPSGSNVASKIVAQVAQIPPASKAESDEHLPSAFPSPTSSEDVKTNTTKETKQRSAFAVILEELTNRLTTFDIPRNAIEEALEIVHTIGYKDSLRSESAVATPKDDVQTIIKWKRERQIIQDADRLDACGAVGIARMFTIGGAMSFKHHAGVVSAVNKANVPSPVMVDLSIVPRFLRTQEAYANQSKSVSTTFNHIFEKLIYLKCSTPLGRRSMKQRQRTLQYFVLHLLREMQQNDDPNAATYQASTSSVSGQTKAIFTYNGGLLSDDEEEEVE